MVALRVLSMGRIEIRGKGAAAVITGILLSENIIQSNAREKSGLPRYMLSIDVVYAPGIGVQSNESVLDVLACGSLAAGIPFAGIESGPAEIVEEIESEIPRAFCERNGISVVHMDLR